MRRLKKPKKCCKNERGRNNRFLSAGNIIDEVKPKEVMLSELFKTKLKIEDELEQELEMAKG